ncbi:predicted protein [Naegleria gruberi]|uniref:Predicted protein n=1 Tax=Naegleria gruberi TaxID=5762 RepID=D2VXR8_NAEGR|nr:uncharacterized protein NAEGRDRAFT_53086 [Naegleria gruberi]EFC38384.1 predicted protein [Naegleria gruberi]|eukprot:XP_002671128.1 predicted protein [Naegleria gruberi strain NEG-M]
MWKFFELDHILPILLNMQVELPFNSENIGKMLAKTNKKIKEVFYVGDVPIITKEFVENTPQLEKLYIEGSISVKYISNINNWKELKTFKTCFNDYIWNHQKEVENLEFFKSLSKCNNLTSLAFENEDISSWEFKELFNKLPNLTELQLVQIETDLSMFQTIGSFTNLKNLSCNWSAKDSIPFISPLRKLERLQIAEVTDSNVSFICELPRIKELEILGSPELTDVGALKIANLKELESIRFEGYQCTHHLVEEICNSCTKLKKVAILLSLPLRASTNFKDEFDQDNDQHGISLAFPHTCSKILRSMDKHNPFQFDKFIQFYCLGIRNGRFEKLQEQFINIENDDLSEVLPIVFYLNFPELTFLEHLKFERDLVLMERKFRRLFKVNRNEYEDFFFKIDRIIEMVSAFINIIKKKVNVEELSQGTEKIISVDTLNIPVSSLLSVVSDVDRVINQCMRIFHWKAYYETYFEEQYLKIPNELVLVSKKYTDCERIISILKSDNDYFLGSIEELYQLFSTIDCYYCDKLAAIICFSFFRQKKDCYEMSSNNVLKEKLLRYLVYYGMHNVPTIVTDCGETLLNDEEIVRRLIYSTPDAYSLIDEKFQKDATIVATCIYQSVQSISGVSNVPIGQKLVVDFFTNNLDEFYYAMETISSRELYVINSIISSFVELSHPTLSKKIHFFYEKRFLKAWYLLTEKEWKTSYFSSQKRRFIAMLRTGFEPIDLYKREILKDDISTIDSLSEIIGIRL